ncbi:hypothetical protein HDU97_006766 [Phlyctochytrium planicorne]|nr:hypothetical protein HDU97_006766 [Phlyctochytrium planicorne]
MAAQDCNVLASSFPSLSASCCQSQAVVCKLGRTVERYLKEVSGSIGAGCPHKLSGCIPDGFRNIADLIQMWGFNSFNSELPASIGSLSKLERLFYGEIPSTYAALAKSNGESLVHFTFDRNLLGGVFPEFAYTLGVRTYGNNCFSSFRSDGVVPHDQKDGQVQNADQKSQQVCDDFYKAININTQNVPNPTSDPSSPTASQPAVVTNSDGVTSLVSTSTIATAPFVTLTTDGTVVVVPGGAAAHFSRDPQAGQEQHSYQMNPVIVPKRFRCFCRRTNTDDIDEGCRTPVMYPEALSFHLQDEQPKLPPPLLKEEAYRKQLKFRPFPNRSDRMCRREVTTWTVDDVARFLESVGVGNGFVEALRVQGVNGYQLWVMTEERLRDLRLGRGGEVLMGVVERLRGRGVAPPEYRG